jgi:hypothetical protein
MALFTKTPAPISRLRAAIQSASRHDLLHSLPDRFAELVTAFENLNVHPDYRADVYALLAGAVKISNAILDHTYPAKEALTEITNLMTTLPRMIHHLTNRPTTTGFAIMVPGTKQIYPQVFSTENEGNRQLGALQKLGAFSSAMVVPVQITSDHAIRPDAPEAEPQTQAWAPQLPAAIKPNIPVHSFEPIDPLEVQDRLRDLEQTPLTGNWDQMLDEVTESEQEPITAPVEKPQIGPLAAENFQAPVPQADSKSPPAPAPGAGNINPSEATP